MGQILTFFLRFGAKTIKPPRAALSSVLEEKQIPTFLSRLGSPFQRWARIWSPGFGTGDIDGFLETTFQPLSPHPLGRGSRKNLPQIPLDNPDFLSRITFSHWRPGFGAKKLKVNFAEIPRVSPGQFLARKIFFGDFRKFSSRGR